MRTAIDLNNIKDLVSAENLSRQDREKYRPKLIHIFAQNLDFSVDSFSISSQEINQLTDYFYTLELMVRCKEAAVRVSPKVWAGIESRMVTVPTE